MVKALWLEKSFHKPGIIDIGSVMHAGPGPGMELFGKIWCSKMLLFLIDFDGLAIMWCC